MATKLNTDYNLIEWNNYFEYNPLSPSGLMWIINKGKLHINDVAGSKAYHDKKKLKPKCWDVRFCGKLYKVHRIIWILLNGAIDNSLVINHIDNNPFNNDSSNLELVDQVTNMRKCSSHTGKCLQINNVTGDTGVSLSTRGGVAYSYSAGWKGEDGSSHTMAFSISKYGDELANKLAKTARIHFIEDLKKKGFQYA